MFEHTKRLKGLLSKVPFIVSGHLSVEVGLAMTHSCRRVLSLYRKSGPLFTALYFKQCSVALQRYYAGNIVVNETLPFSVSLTRSGLPRIIPRRHRHCLSCGDERADYLVRLYLSWFGLSRIIELAKPISRSTFESTS